MIIATLNFPSINLSIKADSTQFGFPSIELVFSGLQSVLGIITKAQGTPFPHRIKTHLDRNGILKIRLTEL